jgi:hypothetical protein
MSETQYGEPLKINELNIKELVDTFTQKGLRTTTSKIMPFHPKQIQICEDPARFKVVACGRRFGKSILCTLIVAAVLLQPGRKVWIVSDTYELTDRVFNELYHIFVTELKWAIHPKGAASRRDRYLRLPNGSTVQGKSCENRDSLVGEAIDLLIWDECALTVNGKDIWNQELRPCLMDRKGAAIFISTPRGKNHFYDFFLWGKKGEELRKLSKDDALLLTDEQKIITNWSSFQFSSYANTKPEGGYLDKAEIDAIRLSIPSTKFKQECLADFESVADRAFVEFNQVRQVTDDDYDPKHGPAYAAMDFNYSTPCTTLYGQIDVYSNILIFDEYHPMEAHTTVHLQAKQMLEIDAKLKNAIGVVVADIAGKQKDLNGRSAWDDLLQWGISPVGRKQPIETGADLIRLWCAYPALDEKGQLIFEEDKVTPVTYPRLFINKRCTALIRSLEVARSPEQKTGGFKEGYRKDGDTDGPLDALRYLLVYLLHDSGYVGNIPTSLGI